ncbi:MAG: lmo0937 family membrane protein [Chloroflexia bacterium]
MAPCWARVSWARTRIKEGLVSETLWVVVIVLVAIWLVGLAIRTIGRVIHILIVIAVAIIAYNYLVSP